MKSTEANYVEVYEKLLETNDIEKSLEFHFSYLCYPPVPLYMIPTAVKALEQVVNGNGCFSIDLPFGVTWRRESSVRAIHVVESLYLQAFVDFLVERNAKDSVHETRRDRSAKVRMNAWKIIHEVEDEGARQ